MYKNACLGLLSLLTELSRQADISEKGPYFMGRLSHYWRTGHGKRIIMKLGFLVDHTYFCRSDVKLLSCD